MKDPRTVIDEVIVTEKGTRLAEAGNVYLFKVSRAANKIDIKRAVETLFKVRVKKVNTMTRIGKNKRERTANFGQTATTKRALVTLHDGHTIEFA